MPLWIYICIWVIWAGWTLLEVVTLMIVANHNSNQFNVMLNGKMNYTHQGVRKLMLYSVLTIFWIGYSINRWF